MLIQLRIVPAQPLQHHGRVLLLLVAIVREQLLQLLIGRGVDTLVVPVDGLELLHYRDDRAVAIDGRRLEDGLALVQGTAAAGH